MNRVRIGLLACALLIAGGCGGEAEAEKPTTFEASGSFTLKQVVVDATPNDQCSGTGGYEDIKGGAQVVIRNAAGEDVGLGELGNGTRDENGAWCDFAILVTDIPISDGIFSIEVSKRGKISFKRVDADELELELG